MRNALTIDVEDYYQVSAFESVVRFEEWERYESRVVRNTHHVLDLLDRHQVKATFFVLGWVAEREPALVRQIQESGHEIASHGYSHKLVYRQSPEKFREETRRSKKILEDITGKPVIGYRAASYSITAKSLWALDILVEEGFKYDSSVFPIKHDLYGVSGFKRFSHFLDGNGGGGIVELPLSTVRMAGINFPVAGGGYLRLFPASLTLRAIRHLNRKEGQPAIVYFHPWEIDPEQPRIKSPWKSRFRHYVNQAGMKGKILTLMENAQFGPMREVFSGIIEAPGKTTGIEKKALTG